MSDVKEESKKSTATIKQTTKTVSEPTYSKQQFIENAEALGYSKPILVGAFFELKKDSFTKSEVDKLVKGFLSTEVE